PGNRLDLEAVDSHWRAVPKFKNITLLNVTEEATKIAMLKTGELDMGEVSPDSAVAVKAAGLRIVLHDGGAQFFIALFYDLENPTKYAIGDVKVRKALSLAIDRKEMGDKLYGGFAQPSAFFYAPRTAYFFDPNVLKPEPFDPEGAKKIIAEAGYPNGFALKVWDLGGGSILSTLDLALAGYWRKVGVNTELTPIDVAALDKIFKPKHTPAMWPTVRPYFTGGGMFGFEKVPLIYDSAVSSFKNMNIPKLNELIRQVPMTRDPAEKKRLALEAAVMAKNDFSMIPILDLITPFAVGPKVGEFAPIKNIAGLAASLETITHAK
ncbi:MAG: ABC transporter substrate-binding protein, partial [Dehalococcoidia bacterium]|nr:ABC transporter substrate-binding protein [Dehalococcoidia bacterium]